MASVSPATSSLASELLLNKIMNGQVKTSTGKSITTAGRAVSASLSGQAYDSRAAEANMAYGEGLVSQAQTQMSSLRDNLSKMRENLSAVYQNSAATTTMYKNEMAKAYDAFQTLTANAKAAEYNGKALLTGTAVTLNAGKGQSIVVLNQTAYTGKVSGATSQLKVVAGTKASVSAAVSALDAAIEELILKEGKYADTVKQLQNQALVLADKGASLDTSAAGQGLAAMNGAGNLLSSILGSSEA